MIYKGNSVSEGIAVGRVICYKPFKPQVEERKISAADMEESLKRFQDALDKSRRELTDIKDGLEQDKNDKSMIFLAHLDILEDEVMTKEITDSISEGKDSPDWAIYKVYNCYIDKLCAGRSSVIRERAADLEDVRNRLLKNWYGIKESNLSELKEPAVVVAHDLLPSDTAVMDRKNILAIITEAGGRTSHSAIIARSYGIPAISGLSGALGLLRDGETVVADATTGDILTDQDEETLAYYRRKREEYLSCVKMLEQYLDKPAVTKDGRRIEIGLNIGSREEDMDSHRKYVDMVGLFRTEFMYMSSDYLPAEEQQFEAYMKILVTFGKKPVILRTLDIGGDKALPCLALPKEENPFLGKRALRLCFDRPELFKTQLRAALRASIYGNLWIMFPMVGSMDDLRRAKKILEEVKQELAEEKITFSKEVKAGIMIEIPSIAIMAEKAAKEVDFASIGTNDLCQYLLAADRINPEVAGYYQSYHPALFSLIGHVAREFHKAGKPICICGELGGDELAVPVLVGLGMDRLSMNFSSVAKIKKLLSEMTIQQMQAYAQAVTGMDTAAEAEEYLRKVLQCS